MNGPKRCYMDQREQLIEVQAGDILSLDTSFYYYHVHISIEQSFSELARPQMGQHYSSENVLVLIGEVMVK